MTKTFFIIPGFMQSAKDKELILKRYLIKKGHRAIVVSIDWKYKTMSDYIEEFKNFYIKEKTDTNFVLGFSYGAVIALMSANQLCPKKIFLCSLSPDFKEDLVKMKPWIKKMIGKKRIKDIENRSGIIVAKNLKIPSVIFYGEKEGISFPQLKLRCEETAKIAKNSKIIIVKDSPHDLNHPNYKESLKKELFSIL